MFVSKRLWPTIQALFFSMVFWFAAFVAYVWNIPAMESFPQPVDLVGRLLGHARVEQACIEVLHCLLLGLRLCCDPVVGGALPCTPPLPSPC